MKLKGRVSIITGGTSGIGRAVSILFTREGSKAIVVGRKEKMGAEVVSEIQAAGGTAFFVKADVTRSAEVQAIVEAALLRFGRIDVLVNAAGILRLGPIADFPEQEWVEVVDTNLKAVFLCCKHVLSHMAVRRSGVVINFSSIAGSSPFSGGGAYCAAKVAVEALTRVLALEYAPYGIRVNCIRPGPIDTPLLWGEWAKHGSLEDGRKRTAKRVPLKRLGTPDEVAGLALYLASDESSFMTGSIMTIDGGITAGRPSATVSR